MNSFALWQIFSRTILFIYNSKFQYTYIYYLQEILIKIQQGETVGDLPAPELFECIICGVSVKYKREHLNKKHQINEDVYDELIAKKSRGKL